MDSDDGMMMRQLVQDQADAATDEEEKLIIIATLFLFTS
jgi:hypothetical protein